MNETQNELAYIFPQETINSLVALGNVLENIYNRMKTEGYDIIDGKIIHIKTGKEYDSKQPGRS